MLAVSLVVMGAMVVSPGMTGGVPPPPPAGSMKKEINYHKKGGWWWDRCLTVSPYLLGTFRSPNYPDSYLNNARCEYILRRWSPDVCVVRLTVRSFDLEETEGCTADYLDLSEGMPAGGETRLCGPVAEGTRWELRFSSPAQRTMVLRFLSDAQTTRPGFDIAYEQLRYSCNGPYPPPPATPQPTLPPIVMPTTPPPPLGGCDQVLTGRSSTLTFPPSWPVVRGHCRFSIPREDPRVCVLYLRLLDFRVGESGPMCFQDFLLLPGGTRLCGDQTGAYFYLYYPAGAPSLDLMFYGSSSTSRFTIQITKGFCGAKMHNMRQNQLK